jgi:hypothetical protein
MLCQAQLAKWFCHGDDNDERIFSAGALRPHCFIRIA